jgi:hydrogenase maturation protease
MTKVLLLGYGNPGRQDDGLGPACADAVERLGLPDVTVDQDYQLNIEDSVAMAAHDVVVFVDADAVGPAPYRFSRVEPKAELSFSSHSIEPGALVALADGLSGRTTEAWMLGIRGYRFDELSEELTPQGRRNLDDALGFLEGVLRDRSFRAAAAGPIPSPAACPATPGEDAR